jgi:colicin import membrane protein
VGVGFPTATTPSKSKMDDPASKSLRDRLDALLRRAREISAEIEKRVEEVTAEPATSGPSGTPKAEPAGATAPGAEEKPATTEVVQEAMEVAAEAVAVTAEAAAVTAEALSTIASESGAAPEIPPSPPDAPTTVVPEAAAAVAKDAAGAPADTTLPAPATKSDSAPDKKTENET